MRLPKLALAGVTLVGMAAAPALAQRITDVGTPGGSVHEVRHRGSAYRSHHRGYRQGHHYGRSNAHRGHHYGYRGQHGYRGHYYGHRGRYYAPGGHFYLDAPYARHYGYPYYGFRYYYAPYGSYGFSFRW